ncbi:MAG: hypothetical protein ABII89_03895 [Candidatus Omnitrophota bacterium]
MVSQKIRAKFREFSLPAGITGESSLIIPTIKSTPFFKYGVHAYYFFNFKTRKGLRVTINHKDIIQPGLTRFIKADYRTYNYLAKLKFLFRRYHYNFNVLEQMMLMTIPHTVTRVQNGHFLINLWSYFGFLDVDCKDRRVRYNLIEESKDDCVLGSQQFYDERTDELYYLSYSLKDSLKRIVAPERKVFCRIAKRENRTGKTKNIWSGEFADYVHDIAVNQTRQYCVICELGMYTGRNGKLIPSRALAVDLKNKKHWIIPRFMTAAHAQFDPDEPDIVYFSNHNFNYTHGSVLKVLRKGGFTLNFRGPASVYKYRLTADGPVELGVFTEPEFFRVPTFHVFNHRGRKILAGIGFPNHIFIADANSMKYIKKIRVDHPAGLKARYRNVLCITGAISPSIDGEKIFAQTTKSFQAVDVASGKAEAILTPFYNHPNSNHMLTATETDW